MTQDILDRPTSVAAPAREKSSPPERLEALYADHREREWRATADRLEALRDSGSGERREIFPDGQRDEIKRGLVRGGDGPGLRFQSLVKAREAGLDLVRVKDLQDRIYGKFADIIRHDTAFTVHDNVIGSLADVFERPPLVFTPPDPNKEKMFFAPYGGAWDRINQNQASGDGRIDENTSHLDGTFARLGSRLRAHNHDAGDIDLLCAYREGGYLVPFKTLKTGILQVKADLTNLFCQHHISTEDEWGWSDFHATTRGRLILAVFWKWEDVDPANEVSDSWFVGGLDCRGDGESFPGTSVQATPGERRIVDLYTTMAFPQGQDLWVYVGLSDRIYAFLNDVEINISVDSAWQLNSLAIRSL